MGDVAAVYSIQLTPEDFESEMSEVTCVPQRHIDEMVLQLQLPMPLGPYNVSAGRHCASWEKQAGVASKGVQWWQ